jgi:hypothetical protein
VQLRQLRGDLVDRREDEAVELDLAHRAESAQRQPDGGADDARLGQRGVEDALLAEVLLQAVGHPEHAAEAADVLAHHDDLGVVLHRRAEAVVERLRHGHRSRGHDHSAPPSNEAWYAR